MVYEHDGRGRIKKVEVPLSPTVVLGIYFALASMSLLTGLETTYIFVFGAWSSEIFAAISLVIGTILGAFFGSRV